MREKKRRNVEKMVEKYTGGNHERREKNRKNLMKRLVRSLAHSSKFRKPQIGKLQTKPIEVIEIDGET